MTGLEFGVITLPAVTVIINNKVEVSYVWPSRYLLQNQFVERACRQWANKASEY